jgi:hypothetical protein
MSSIETNAPLAGLYIPGDITAGDITATSINIPTLTTGEVKLVNNAIPAPNSATLVVDAQGNLEIQCPNGGATRRLTLQANGDAIFFGNQLFLENSDASLVGSLGGSGAPPGYRLLCDAGEFDRVKLQTLSAGNLVYTAVQAETAAPYEGLVTFPKGVADVVVAPFASANPSLSVNTLTTGAGNGLSLVVDAATNLNTINHVGGGVGTPGVTLTGVDTYIRNQILTMLNTGGGNAVIAAGTIGQALNTGGVIKAIANALYRVSIPCEYWTFPSATATDFCPIQVVGATSATIYDVFQCGATPSGGPPTALVQNGGMISFIFQSTNTEDCNIFIDVPGAPNVADFTFVGVGLGGDKIIVERLA